jgi:hypothetical protein
MILMAAEKTKYVTGKVYLMYPRITKKGEWKGKLTYSVNALFPKESNEGKKIKELLLQMWKENKLGKKDHNPLKDGDEYAEEQKEKGRNADFARGMYFIKSSSVFDIKVIDGKKMPFTGNDEEINGNWGRISMVLAPYDNDGKGITAYLYGVQVLGKSDIEIASAINIENDFDFEEVDSQDDELPF